MLIINNGAAKSGSSWVNEILAKFGCFKVIPEQYQNPNWINSSIGPDLASEALTELSASSNHYQCKQHWSAKNPIDTGIASFIGTLEDIKVINIMRDPRDAVVSWYHHLIRNKRIADAVSFEEFFPDHGKRFLRRLVRFHQYWANHSGLQDERYLLVFYEEMKIDPLPTVERLAKFCGIDETAERLETVAASTVFETMPKARIGPEKHLRKGVVGGFRESLPLPLQAAVRERLTSEGWFELVETRLSIPGPVADLYLA